MKILIVDDNDNKRCKIQEALKTVTNIHGIDVDSVDNLKDAYGCLKHKSYDILILDIQIPFRAGEEVRKDGGIRFLEQLELGGDVNFPISIVGLTAFEESISEHDKYFQNYQWTLVRYDDASNEWITKISHKVQYIAGYKERERNRAELFDFDLGIVCALFRLELENVKKVIGSWEEKVFPNDSTKYFTCEKEIRGKKLKIVAAAAPQMGMPAAATVTTKIISHFRPKYLAMCGIAAGVRSKKLNYGDILVADPSWDYGSGKISDISGEKTFLPDPKQIRIDADLQSIFQEISTDRSILNTIRDEYSGKKPNTILNLSLGPVASGAAVVADQQVVTDTIKQHRNVIGLEMETYGVYCAAYYGFEPRPKFFSLKSVCDYADASKDDDYQDYAAYTSARMLRHIIETVIAR